MRKKAPRSRFYKTVYAFIDSQNLNLGVKSSGWELDFGRFLQYLRTKYKVKKAFLFIGYVSKNQGLYDLLEKQGYILLFKPTLAYSRNKKTIIKGNVDAELVLHTMIHWNEFDRAIIVSGDGDFYCLIEYLEKKKKLAKIIVPNSRHSSLLTKFSNYIIQVEFFKDKVKKGEAFPRRR